MRGVGVRQQMGILQQECGQPKAARSRLQKKKEASQRAWMEEWRLLLVAGLRASLKIAPYVVLDSSEI